MQQNYPLFKEDFFSVNVFSISYTAMRIFIFEQIEIVYRLFTQYQLIQ